MFSIQTFFSFKFHLLLLNYSFILLKKLMLMLVAIDTKQYKKSTTFSVF